METIKQMIEDLVIPDGRNLSGELLFLCPYKINKYGGNRRVNLFDCEHLCYRLGCEVYKKVIQLER
ncbi:hypothetical protein ACFL1H_04950 [Nanoarchaeota archaeon]